MIEIAQGSKESILVDVDDRLDAVDDLSSLSPTFDVLDETGTPVVTDGIPSVAGMQLRCLVDTTNWDIARYTMYVTFQEAFEIPRLGPIRLKVIA